MSQIDPLSQILGSLQEGFKALRERQDQLHSENKTRIEGIITEISSIKKDVNDLVRYRWKIAGLVGGAGAIVEFAHLMTSSHIHP